ncbi:hypothetical protein B0H13DRAFT_1989337, partial [Mycena leptocephala]
MLFTIQSTVFNSFWDAAAAELFSVMVRILLVLVAFAVNLLYRRQASGGRVLLVATAVMFLLATLQFAFRILAAQKAYEVFYLAVAGKFSPHVVTDGILIYRCFLIWGKNYYHAVLSAISAVEGDYPVPQGASTSYRFFARRPTNIVLVGLTAGDLTHVALYRLAASIQHRLAMVYASSGLSAHYISIADVVLAD